METNLKYINQICVDLGGTGGHILNVQGENEICTLLGGTGGHSLEINALNEICTIQGVTAGHSLVLNALNAIAGVTKVTNLEAWKYIQSGSVLNQIDSDAKAFYTAANITDESLQLILNDLVKDYKAAGLWTKRKAIYPFVGSSAGATKLNLKDPRDSDEAYRITWNGAITHDSGGVKGDGLSGYGNSHFSVVNDADYDNISFGVFSGDDQNTIINGYEIGVQDSVQYAIGILRAVGVGLTAGDTYSPLAITPFNNTHGWFCVTRKDNQTAYQMRNGNVVYTKSAGITNTSTTTELALLALNNAGTIQKYSSRQIRFAVLGDGLSPFEAATEYYIIRRFNDAMNDHNTYHEQIQLQAWQGVTPAQIDIKLKVNTGHIISFDWGDETISEVTGDGSIQTISHTHSIGSKTYYMRMYGDLIDVIKFDLSFTSTSLIVCALNISDFKRLNIPLYELDIAYNNKIMIDIDSLPLGLTVLSLISNSPFSKGSLVNLPKYLRKLSIQGTSEIGQGLGAMPQFIYDVVIGASSIALNIDNFSENLQNLTLLSVLNSTGTLSNLSSNMNYISIEACGTGINVTDGTFPEWAETDIIIKSGYSTASVDGFFNKYALTAGNGIATLDLSGTNQADSAASSAAQSTLLSLGKTIITN